MLVDVILSAGDVLPRRVEDRNAAVIDVFRATSVIVEAMSNGAKAIYPVATIEEAIEKADKLGRDNVLLAGERNTVMIDGFDLDNSPLKFTREVVAGKIIVQTTTNGTRAVRNASPADNLYVASFLNMKAVCEKLAEGGKDIAIVCSGRCDEYTAEDGLCAGAMAEILSEDYGCGLTDIAEVMVRTYKEAKNDLKAGLATARHYNDILRRGYNADIEFCLKRNIYDIVPYYTGEDCITLGK